MAGDPGVERRPAGPATDRMRRTAGPDQRPPDGRTLAAAAKARKEAHLTRQRST